MYSSTFGYKRLESLIMHECENCHLCFYILIACLVSHFSDMIIMFMSWLMLIIRMQGEKNQHLIVAIHYIVF